MKKLIYVALLFFSVNMFAQNYERTDRWGYDIYAFEMLPDSSYFLAGSDGYIGVDYSIHYQDESKINLSINSTNAFYFQFMVAPTGGYYVSYLDASCDVIGSYILKLDENGNQLWTLTDPLVFDNIKMTTFTNDELLYTQGTKIFKVDGDSDFLWDVELGVTIHDVATDPDDNIYVALPSGLFKLDENGDDLDIDTDNILDEIMVNDDGLIAAINSDSIFIFNSDLTVLNQFDISASGNNILEFDFNVNYISVLLGHDTSAYAVEVRTFDVAMNEVGSFAISDGVDYEQIELNGNEIWLAGREIYGMEEYASVVKNFSFEGVTETYMADVSLYNLYVDSIGWEVVDWYEKMTFYGVEVTLQNESVDTLESVWVSVLGGYSMNPWCNWRSIVSQEFTGLSLPPGEGLELSLDDLEYNIQSSVNDLELCYYAHLPNRHIDLDHTDNFSCSDFLVDVDEAFNQNIELDVFPNPTSNFLYINLSEPLIEKSEIHILNNYGQIVHTDFLYGYELEKRIEVGEVPAGIYYLKIINEERIISKRFVKN